MPPGGRRWGGRITRPTGRGGSTTDAAEPEDRLVARDRERRWEQGLAEARRVGEDHARYQAEQPRELTAAERDRIRALAADLPALWQAATTRGSDRRASVRLLIDRVELTRRGETELVDVVVPWRGGARGRHVVRQRPRSYPHLGRYDELRARVTDLRALISRIKGTVNYQLRLNPTFL